VGSGEQLRTLTEVIDILGRSREPNLNNVYDAALVGLQRALGLERASILLFDPDGVMRFKAWRGISDNYRKAVEGHTPWTPGELDAVPLVVADVQEDPSLQSLLPIFHSEQIRALAFIPLTFERRVLGKFMLYSHQPHSFTNELDFSVTLGRLIGFAITRLRTENELQQSEATKSAIFESALDNIISMNHEGKIVDLNLATEKTFGFRRSDVLGRELAELFIPERLRAAHRAGLARYLATGSGPVIGRRIEFPARRADGTEFAAEISISRVDRPGSPLFSAFLRDVTERNRAREQTEQHLSLLEATIESTADGILVVDANGNFVRNNQKFLDLWRIPKELRNNPNQPNTLSFMMDQLVDPAILLSRFKEPPANSGIESMDVLDFKDGRIFELYSQPQRIAQAVVGRVWSFRDITALTRIQQQLRKSEKRLRVILETEPECVKIVDRNGKVLEMNPAGLAMIEVDDAAKVIGRNFYAFVVEPHREKFQRFLERVCNGESGTLEYEIIGNRGTHRWLETHAVPYFDEESGIPASLAVTRDVSTRKLAEEKLVRAHKDAQYLSNASRALVTSLDYEATLETMARLIVPELGQWSLVGLVDDDESFHWRAWVEDPERHEVARNLEQATPAPNGRGTVAGVMQSAKAIRQDNLEDPHLVSEQTIETLLGQTNPAIVSAFRTLGFASVMIVPLVLRDKPIGVCLISSRPDKRYDPSDLVLAEELARRAAVALENSRLYRESLRSIQLRDDFISIASHELRTPLTPLKLQLFLLKHHLEDISSTAPNGETLLRVLQSSNRQLNRITRLIDDLFDVSRLTRGRLELNLEETCLDEVVHEVVERCRNELANAKCILRFEDSRVVRGNWDKLRIEQVVENLLTNAMKYGAGKPIDIVTSQHGDWARLEVHDSGIGIAKEDHERVFQRFERAVPVTAYGGLGLGLFITRQIVSAHRGTVRIESEVGKGSTFIVELPLSLAGSNPEKAGSKQG